MKYEVLCKNKLKQLRVAHQTRSTTLKYQEKVPYQLDTERSTNNSFMQQLRDTQELIQLCTF